METLIKDISFGVRGLLRRPAFASIVVVILALGIGANTAIFSVVHAVLLNPLPFADQDRVVVGWKQDTTIHNPFIELSYAEIKDWQTQTEVFDGLAAMPTTVYGYGYVLTGRGEPLQLESAKVTGRFFSILGVHAALGRTFDESDDRVNGPHVVVISHKLWSERCNADPNIIGKTITLNREAFTVLGVMPASFNFPQGIDLWLPLLTVARPEIIANRSMIFLQVIGRLKPGVTVTQAEGDLNTIIARLASQYPETKANDQRVVLKRVADHLFGSAKPALWALFVATGLLLLVAAGNIANLLLARTTTRRREFAVRAALGASRARIVRQLLSESLVLAVCGLAGGVLLAYWFIYLLIAVTPADIPRLEEVRLSRAALLVSFLSMLVSVIIFGLLPALSVSRLKLTEVLTAVSTKLAGVHSGKRLRASLVVGQITLTLVLLASAMLILRSFINLNRVPLGFNPEGVLTMQLRLEGQQYTRLIEQLEGQPGISAASGVLIRPLEGTVGWDWDFTIEGQSIDLAHPNPEANLEVVHPHYFAAFRIPLKAGRAFEMQDDNDHLQVAIVSEGLAQRYFGSALNALGRRIKLGGADSEYPWRQIVGVAGDARYRDLREPRLDLYLPFAQWPFGIMNHFAVRSTLEPSQTLALVRRELASIDPTIAVSRVATMDELVAIQLARPRFSAALLNWLAVLAVLLAGAGIYGVMACAVTERTSELGLRIALGAEAGNILKLVIGQGMVPVLYGITLGLILSFALTRWLASLLFAVSPTDPLIFAGIALLLTLVALASCFIPAWRATKVDPLVALRYE